jgi:ribonuclease R
MQHRVGEVFTGIISSVTDFGFWVEIKEVMAEGMVRLSTVVDDYYLFDQTYQRLIGKRYGRIFQIGNRVKVKLCKR